jgi:hypothetical protein
MMNREQAMAGPPSPILVGDLTLIGTAAPQTAPAETWSDFGMMSQRRAGQVYDPDGNLASQWAWSPRGGGVYDIAWGEPSDWPPDYLERFRVAGSWVMIDGWWGSGGAWHRIDVAEELLCDAECESCVRIATSGSHHYAKRTIPAEPYCLKAWGTITNTVRGGVRKFSHRQIWHPPQAVSNPYLGMLGDARAIRQWESWWDDERHPGVIERVFDRDVYLAKGLGMGFKIDQHWHRDDPTPWQAYGRHYWGW